MLLAIDIGNTNITFGVFKGMRLLKKYAFPTKGISYFRYLKNIFSRHNITEALLCSVVPQSSTTIKRQIKELLGRPPILIGKDIKVPIRNLYRRPQEVGQDRLVNAYAGIMLYGAPLIVVDFGTAITFDIVSRKKEYLGGMIIPGLQISLDALAARTALLPKVKLGLPKEFIGKDTKNSMLSGVVYGFACLTDDLSSRIKKEIGNAKVIGTGGNIQLLGSYCRNFNRIDADLTLRGINLIYRHISLRSQDTLSYQHPAISECRVRSPLPRMGKCSPSAKKNS